MSLKVVLVVVGLIICFSEVRAKPKDGECEVCVQFLSKFTRRMKENGIDSSVNEIELELLKVCKEATDKEERFCYYIGAADTSATRLIKSVSKPLSFSKPVEKICKELSKQDSQICELKYEKQIDLNTVDLNKLRVRDLKKILTQWGEDCRGCVEKTEFIDKINIMKVKHFEL